MDDDEVAIVLGHELVDASHEHTRRQFKKQMWIQLAALGFAAATENVKNENHKEVLALLGTFGAMAWKNGHGRSLEDQADRVGLRYAYEAGYDITKGAAPVAALRPQVRGARQDQDLLLRRPLAVERAGGPPRARGSSTALCKVHSVTQKRDMVDGPGNPVTSLPSGTYRFAVGGQPGANGVFRYSLQLARRERAGYRRRRGRKLRAGRRAPWPAGRVSAWIRPAQAPSGSLRPRVWSSPRRGGRRAWCGPGRPCGAWRAGVGCRGAGGGSGGAWR
jgi:hypothetical protein